VFGGCVGIGIGIAIGQDDEMRMMKDFLHGSMYFEVLRVHFWGKVLDILKVILGDLFIKKSHHHHHQSLKGCPRQNSQKQWEANLATFFALFFWKNSCSALLNAKTRIFFGYATFTVVVLLLYYSITSIIVNYLFFVDVSIISLLSLMTVKLIN
jgi:hypothetical protein